MENQNQSLLNEAFSRVSTLILLYVNVSYMRLDCFFVYLLLRQSKRASFQFVSSQNTSFSAIVLFEHSGSSKEIQTWSSTCNKIHWYQGLSSLLHCCTEEGRHCLHIATM